MVAAGVPASARRGGATSVTANIGGVRTIGVTERRARLARRHFLGVPAGDVVEVAERLVGLHATDPATVHLSARARVAGLTVADVERSLYDDATLLRHLAMRRTLFVLPTAMLAMVRSACTDAIAAVQRRRLVADVQAGGLAADGARWLRAVERATLAVLARTGPATGAELARAVPALQAKLVVAPDRTWGGEVGVATRVFTVLAAEGRIVRGRPQGTWTSSRHRWTRAPPRVGPPPPAPVARAELVRRWLGAFGPATVADLRWWSGLGAGLVRAALGQAGVVEVRIEGETEPGLVLAGDLEPVEAPEPWVALLPSLDPTTMGWQRREWYLGAHGPALFDRNGNAGPTVWCDGRVVGGWGQGADGALRWRIFDDIGADAMARVEAEAARLEHWLAGTRVTPRFPTPLERELRA